MTATIDAPLGLRTPASRTQIARRAIELLRTHGAIFGIILVALLLRTYRLDIVGIVADTYERQIATQRLLAGDFPLSNLYPPGVSIILTPFFLVLPDSLWTIQAVIIAFSLALVLLGYAATMRLTNSRATASLVAVALSVSPLFVKASRVGLFDVIDSFVLALAVFGLPALRGRGLWLFAAYAFLLALLINIRPTYIVCLPALLLYWTYLRGGGLHPMAFWRCLTSREVAVAGLALAGLCLISVEFAGGFAYGGRVALSLDSYASNLVFYVLVIVYGPAVLLLLPLAIAGGFRLWRIEQGLTVAIAMVVFAWPLVSSPFNFANARYMLPVVVFVYFLAAIGLGELLRLTASSPRLRSAIRVYLGIAFTAVGALFLILNFWILDVWPTVAAGSDEGHARVMRPAVRELEQDALVLTAVARAFHGTNDRLQYVDLIDHSVRHGSSADGRALVAERIREAFASGRAAYYLYIPWDPDRPWGGWGARDPIDPYFATVSESFKVTEIKAVETGTTETDRLRNRWVLYRVEAPE